MDRTDLQRLSREELIELVLQLQRDQKPARPHEGVRGQGRQGSRADDPGGTAEVRRRIRLFFADD